MEEVTPVLLLAPHPTHKKPHIHVHTPLPLGDTLRFVDHSTKQLLNVILSVLNTHLQVAHLNFSPSYNSSTEATRVTHYFNKVVSLVCAEDVLSSSTDIRTEVCVLYIDYFQGSIILPCGFIDLIHER